MPPSRGPLVFFTGGTALRSLSRELARRTRDTVHLVTTYDSGGSTATLRKAFAMPAVGDLRNRLAAMADLSAASAALVRFMETRLPMEEDAEELRRSLRAMGRADSALWQNMDEVAGNALRGCLHAFLQAMPADFDARGACLGNLCMAGKYLLEHRSLSAALPLFSQLLHVRGQVLPIVEESLHLAARLEDGTLLLGQHLLKSITSPIRELYLTVYEPGRGSLNPVPCQPRASSHALDRLRAASLVCYPMGSFYSSLLATLLAGESGACVAGLSCPKVFIPNTGTDHELMGHSIDDQLRTLIAVLTRNLDGASPRDLLSHILIDKKRGRYQGDLKAFERTAEDWGISVVDAGIVREDGLRHDAVATADLLMHLAGMTPPCRAAGLTR